MQYEQTPLTAPCPICNRRVTDANGRCKQCGHDKRTTQPTPTQLTPATTPYFCAICEIPIPRGNRCIAHASSR